MATKLVNAIRYLLTECPHVVSLQELVTKTRVELQQGYTLDLYYNETLGKYGYTLILNNQRIMGWDNAPHHPELTNTPHHFHATDGSIHPSPLTGNPERDIVEIVVAINKFFEQ